MKDEERQRSSTPIDSLKQFEIPDIVRIEPGKGGLTKIVVTSPQAGAEIYVQGAHVTRFEPAGKQPVLWMSQSSMFEPGKPIRGGVPVCFPWFGPRKDDPKSPAHGFARLREWAIESISHKGNDVVVALVLASDESTRSIWPFDFVARHTITIGSALRMRLEVQNKSAGPIRFEEALHTYFTVGDVKQISIEGLAGTKYIDKVDGAKTKDQVDPQIRFTGETDRVYLDTKATCVINDPVMKRRIEISKSGSNATVVWNPWINKSKAMPDFGDDEWPGMVCVETANAAQHAMELPAGKTHSMTASIRLA
jgi:glucose-6-phosphate 1-epimerase